MERSGSYDRMYEKEKKLTSKETAGHGIAVQDKDGLLLQDHKQIRGQWKEYVEDLYQGKDRP